MAQSPKNRRSPSTRKPVTIDLEAEAVSETPSNTEQADAETAAEPVAFENLTEKPSADKVAEEARSEVPENETPNEDNGQSEETNEAASAPPPPTNQKSSSSGLVSGLVGGLIAIIGLGGLQLTGLLPSFGGDTEGYVEEADLAALQSEIDALKVQLTEAPASVEGGVDEATQNQIASAIQASDEALTGVSSVEQSITDLSAQLTELQSAISAGEAGEGAGLEAVSQRLDAADQQIASLVAQLEDVATAGASAESAEQISAITSQVANIQSVIDDQAAGLAAFQEGVAGQLSDLETQIGDLAAKIAEIESGGEAGANVATAIAAAGLKNAVDRGGAFMTELEAYAQVSADTETVEGLRSYAAAGVPTIIQLSERFPAVANRIVAAGEGLSDDASVMDRLMTSARSLVQVRPVGVVEGDTPGAIAARLEAHLAEGKLAEALVEWDALPDAAKEISADFADQMRARQAVDTLLGQALTGAMAITAPQPN